MPQSDPFDLARFLQAQDPVFEDVLLELRSGRKRSHWMWFVFPQFEGLGFSPTTRKYALKSLAEARAYLDHAILGPRLMLCAQILLDLDGSSAGNIFGPVDEMKLRSSMTLFARVAGPDSSFVRVLTKYFGGELDSKTIELLAGGHRAAHP